MRGVVGLSLLIVGASMAWLIILGKFPSATKGPGLLEQLISLNQGGSTTPPPKSTATTGGAIGPAPKGG